MDSNSHPHRPSPRAPARAALASLALCLMDRIGNTDVLAVADPIRGPETVHRIRVQLRRLRCVLRLLGRCTHDPAVDRVRAATSYLLRRTGAVRDADAALALLARLRVPASTRSAAVAAIRARRKIAVGTLGAPVVDVPAADRAGIAALCKGRRGRSLRALVRRQLRRDLEVLQELLAVDLSDPVARHAVRRQARRIRDTVDVLDHAAGRRGRRWRRRLTIVHAPLGALQDGVVTSAMQDPHDPASRLVKAALRKYSTACLSIAAPALALLARDLATGL